MASQLSSHELHMAFPVRLTREPTHTTRRLNPPLSNSGTQTKTDSTHRVLHPRPVCAIVQVEISSGQGVVAPRNGFLPRRPDKHVKMHERRVKAVLPIPMRVIFPRLLMRLTRLLFCFKQTTLGAGVLEPHKSWDGPCSGNRIGRNRLGGWFVKL
jgi:hypothetical protein